jgi:hypothetical protein
VALDDILGLELSQALRQQTIGQTWNGRQYFVEAARLADKYADDRTGPALADQFDGLVKARAEFGELCRRAIVHGAFQYIRNRLSLVAATSIGGSSIH